MVLALELAVTGLPGEVVAVAAGCWPCEAAGVLADLPCGAVVVVAPFDPTGKVVVPVVLPTPPWSVVVLVGAAGDPAGDPDGGGPVVAGLL